MNYFKRLPNGSIAARSARYTLSGKPISEEQHKHCLKVGRAFAKKDLLNHISGTVKFVFNHLKVLLPSNLIRVYRVNRKMAYMTELARCDFRNNAEYGEVATTMFGSIVIERKELRDLAASNG